MDFKEYGPLAMRTAKLMSSLDSTLTHGAMGCMTEAGEVAETVVKSALGGELDRTNLLEELGDGLWFAEYMVQAVGSSLDAIMASEPLSTPREIGVTLTQCELEWLQINTLSYCASSEKIGTLVKAAVCYGKPLDFDALHEAIRNYTLANCQLLFSLGFSLDYVLEANVKKLRKRYHDKYSDAAAIERADKMSESFQEKVTVQSAATYIPTKEDVAAILGNNTDQSFFDRGVELAREAPLGTFPRQKT